MGSIISLFLTWLFNFLLSVLPLSPFANLRITGEIDTAIGWLNWFCPVNEMVTMFLAWIAAALFVTVVGFVIDNFEKIQSWLMGGA